MIDIASTSLLAFLGGNLKRDPKMVMETKDNVELIKAERKLVVILLPLARGGTNDCIKMTLQREKKERKKRISINR